MKTKPELSSLYLFADGHAVVIYRKIDKQAGPILWAEIHEKFGPRCNFEGRIVFHGTDGILKLCRSAYAVRAKGPSLDQGTQATKKQGYRVGTLTVQFSAHWEDAVYFHDIPDLISAPFTIQPENSETFDAEATHWAGHHVAKIHRVKQPIALVPAAA